MSTTKSPRTEQRRWVSTELSEDTHRALLRIATQKGKHPSKIVEQFIIDGITTYATMDFAEADIEVKIYAAVQATRRQGRILAQMRQLALDHQANPTEESADILKSLCEEAEIDLNDLLSETGDSSIVPLRLERSDDVSTWLASQFKDAVELPVQSLLDKGNEAGYANSAITAARRRMGITSERRSKGWVWVRPTPVEVQQSEVLVEANNKQSP